MIETTANLPDLDKRSREIFRQIVESYLETGDPVGSRSISRHLPMKLSPASVRNVMSDLEYLGLISSPHTSAGRIPTQSGLRLFIDGLLEIGDISTSERREIERQIGVEQRDRAFEDMLSEAGDMLSGLSHCAGVVLVDQQITRIKHIEFVQLEPQKALVVLVGEDGNVENRVIDLPDGLTSSALTEAANYVNMHIRGKTLAEALKLIESQLSSSQRELDVLTARVVKAGLAIWSHDVDGSKNLIVRGRSHLLNDMDAAEDLERIQKLFDDLEAKNELIRLLGLAESANGVRIFIGSESQLFSLSGSSLVVAPFQDADNKIVGVLGVIGPTRLNYARIIPMVDYTARLMGHLIS